MIIGGKEKDGSESTVVEEIDFIKRNIVSIAPLNVARSQSNAFLVNDAIYVFGGCNKGIMGEKYILNENKWRQILGKIDEGQYQMGPVALLYE